MRGAPAVGEGGSLLLRLMAKNRDVLVATILAISHAFVTTGPDATLPAATGKRPSSRATAAPELWGTDGGAFVHRPVPGS